MAFCLLIFSLFILSLLHLPRSTANLHSFRSHPIPDSSSAIAATVAADSGDGPTTYFEVTKPITPNPKIKPCSYLALQHEFANTYGKPPIRANYKPPSNYCPHHKNFSKIILEWSATSKGRQFDRIFGVWLNGVEILRSCTAEPRPNGVVWTVKKDITRYQSLLMKEQSLAVYMGNVVDGKYTGVYHVNLTFHFYPVEENYNGSNNDDGVDSRADLILPISRNLPLNDGLWFEIENSTHVERKEFKIPQNVYRAVLEVYVSFHENDEFWYGNFPDEYNLVNNLSYPGNGPFREVVVKLDGLLVGAIWPFTVIYTGGVNPFLWRPISGIGSFDLPTYDIEITPFLGRLLDGKNHNLLFSVTNALNVWYVDANLHLWLDKKSEKTQGKVLKHRNSPLLLSIVSNVRGFDGLFTTNVSRSIVSSGWVKSSDGVIITKSRQDLKYSNVMVLGNQSNLQILDQTIKLKGSVGFNKPSSSTVWSTKLFRKFSVFLYSDSVDKGNGTQVFLANVTLGFDEKSRKSSDLGSSISRLENSQNGHGYMLLKNDDLVGGLGSTRQDYRFSGGKSCYSRNVRSSNYTILHDKESNICGHSELGTFDHGEKEEKLI